MRETGADEYDIGGGELGPDPQKIAALFVQKPGSQATRQDVGKFMKHGRQLPSYRKSIKTKKKIEDN